MSYLLLLFSYASSCFILLMFHVVCILQIVSCKLHYMFQVFSFFACSFYIFFCLLLFWLLLEETMKQKSLLPLPCWCYFHHCVVATFVIVLFLFSPLCYYFCCVTNASNMLYVTSNMLHATSNMLLLVPMCCCYFYHTIGVSDILLLLSLCYWYFCHVVAFAIYMYLPLPMLLFCPFVSIMLLSALV